MRFFASLLVALSLCGCGASTPINKGAEAQAVFVPKPINLDTVFHIQLDWDERPQFFGYLDKRASTDSNGSPMYSGDAGLGGLVVQTALHAAISNSVQKKRKKDAQDKADKVLLSYEDLVEAVSHNSLYESISRYEAEKRFILRQDIDQYDMFPDDVVVNLNPVYYMSPDEKSLMLLMDMQVHRRASPDDIIFEQTAKTISRPLDTDSPEKAWRAESLTYFESISGKLFAESLSLLLEDLISDPEIGPVPQKTYKYSFGGKDRYERASLIRQSFERTYIRNLKGNIVAIPTIKGPGDK